MLRPSHSIPSLDTVSPITESDHIDMEKHHGSTNGFKSTSDSGLSSGLKLLAKKSTGMTKHLKAHNDLFTFLDVPYPNNPSKDVLRCDRLLLIGGGIGITSLLPCATKHWNVKLSWSVKTTAKCVVDVLGGALSGIAERDVRIGTRLNVHELLADELESGWHRIGVVVSRPAGLCDDVRAAVAAAGRKGDTVFVLEVEAYSW